ncbi:MAG TPA: hypothetical protein VJ987_07715 [Anaerolineales bacterium]|nr:hypothetical protein [Anaerolineales bacterium]
MMTSKTSHTGNVYHPKQRGFDCLLWGLAIITGLLLVYGGYCLGVWGRNSLLLQYLFQCNCPPATENMRYPENVDLIIPACKYVSSKLSPSGRYLYVNENENGITSTYLLDLRTYEKSIFFLPEGPNYFLTDDLIFFSIAYGKDTYLLDRRTGERYPIREFSNWSSNTNITDEVNLNMLASALRSFNNVFLIDDDALVALNQDFRTYPERNFFVHRSSFPGFNPNRVQEFLTQNNISYRYVSDGFPGEAVSLDGRFIGRDDGIYLTRTNQKIVDGYATSKYYRSYSGKYFSVRGWVYDNSGVIYSKFPKPCLIEIAVIGMDGSTCYFQVPQPVIKIKVPEEYLPSTKVP